MMAQFPECDTMSRVKPIVIRRDAIRGGAARTAIPAITRPWPNAFMMVAWRGRDWANIKQALGERHAFTVI